ncbi:hypothetical protein FSB64_22830 [Paraburkholderia sp. JPY454]|uniref:Uncharacterized protein n=1 Tax=Paraburkholderia youngii TaxID=2782701 RepID=A0ABX2NR45_9BURK|nr:hypothetical protein [Paraburkholderia youngii]
MITPVVVDRKSWLFADTVAGAQASADLYSLVKKRRRLCRAHAISTPRLRLASEGRRQATAYDLSSQQEPPGCTVTAWPHKLAATVRYLHRGRRRT